MFLKLYSVCPALEKLVFEKIFNSLKQRKVATSSTVEREFVEQRERCILCLLCVRVPACEEDTLGAEGICRFHFIKLL